MLYRWALLAACMLAAVPWAQAFWIPQLPINSVSSTDFFGFSRKKYEKDDASYLDRAKELLKHHPLVDTHNDFAM